jgi:hypothetical protein
MRVIGHLLKLLEHGTLYTGCVSPQGQAERAFTHMKSAVYRRSATAFDDLRAATFLADRGRRRADPNERSALCHLGASAPAFIARQRERRRPPFVLNR